MITSGRIAVFTVLLVMGLILVGCGTVPTRVAEQEGGFVLALPRITIDVDSEGMPTIAGLTMQQIKTLTFGQVDLTGLRFPQEWVNGFTANNLQHIELVHEADGIHLFANGKPMPHIGWTAQSLAKVGDIAAGLGFLDARTAGILRILVPFAQRTGLDIAIRFPLREGAEPIPLHDPNAPASAMVAEEPMAQVRAHVTYDENGIPSILSISTRDLESSLGLNLRALELNPALLETMKNAGIQHITVRSTANGLFLWVNQDPLPGLIWSDDYLKNVAELYGQLYSTADYAAIREAVSMILPVINNIDAEIVLKFPKAPGAADIPLPTP